MGQATLPTMIVGLANHMQKQTSELPHWNYCNYGESFSDGVNNYFTASLEMPGPDGSTIRTVICRLIIPLPVARAMCAEAQKLWTKGGH